MAIFSSWKGGLLLGLIVGAGAGFAVPVIAPGVGKAARPKLKAAVKAGVLAFERGRIAFEELREEADDLVAETLAELADERGTASHAQGAAQPAGRRPDTSPDDEMASRTGPAAPPRRAA